MTPSHPILLALARTGAVLFALFVLGCLVRKSHKAYNPDSSAPMAKFEEAAPVIYPSTSKNGDINHFIEQKGQGDVQSASEKPAVKKQSRAYLSTSKSFDPGYTYDENPNPRPSGENPFAPASIAPQPVDAVGDNVFFGSSKAELPPMPRQLVGEGKAYMLSSKVGILPTPAEEPQEAAEVQVDEVNKAWMMSTKAPVIVAPSESNVRRQIEFLDENNQPVEPPPVEEDRAWMMSSKAPGLLPGEPAVIVVNPKEGDEETEDASEEVEDEEAGEEAEASE